MARLAFTVDCLLTVGYTEKQSMGGFFGTGVRWTEVDPLRPTTVVVRFEMHGLLANPGRHSHTVPDASAPGVVNTAVPAAAAVPAAPTSPTNNPRTTTPLATTPRPANRRRGPHRGVTNPAS